MLANCASGFALNGYGKFRKYGEGHGGLFLALVRDSARPRFEEIGTQRKIGQGFLNTLLAGDIVSCVRSRAVELWRIRALVLIADKSQVQTKCTENPDELFGIKGCCGSFLQSHYE